MNKKLGHKLLMIFILIGLIIIQLTLLIKSSYTVWPEMILYPWMMMNNYALYQDIINPYTPLLPVTLAGYFSLFGISIDNLKLFTYLIISINTITVFWAARKISQNIYKAFLAVFIYIALQYSYGGNGLWFELALTPLLLVGLIFVYLDIQNKIKLVTAGVLIGLAILIKQNTALFLFPIGFLFLVRKEIQNSLYFIAPVFICIISLFIYLQQANLFQEFFQWAVKLPLFYSSQPGFVSMPALRQYPLIIFPLLVLIGMISWKMKNPEKIFWFICFILATLFAFPRYENFHLQVLIGLSTILTSLMEKRFLVIFAAITLLIFVKTERTLWQKSDRFIDQETISLAENIKNYPSVYLLNSPDLAYFFANKLPPKLWAINFPWYFEQPGFEEKFIDNLNREKTDYIVIRNPLGGGIYDLGNYLPQKLVRFVHQNYLQIDQINQYQIWQRK